MCQGRTQADGYLPATRNGCRFSFLCGVRKSSRSGSPLACARGAAVKEPLWHGHLAHAILVARELVWVKEFTGRMPVI